MDKVSLARQYLLLKIPTLPYRPQIQNSKYKNNKTLITITTGGGRGESQKNIQSWMWRMPEGSGGGFPEVLDKPCDDVTSHT